MKYFRLTWMLLLFGGGILASMPSCSSDDPVTTEKPGDTNDPGNTDDPDAPQIPDDPNPPAMGYISQKMVEGELMYYGHDPEYSKEGGAVYFLYLKDLKSNTRGCSVCFYVNVPRQQKGQYILPEGKYTAGSTWDINTFNDKNTEKYKSNWNVIDPKWVQYVVEDGEFEVSMIDTRTYRIKGWIKGGSIQDDRSIVENEYGIAFSYTGRLPVADYSEDYENPDDPEPETPRADMTVGSLYRYNDNVYYLQLKDANPTDLYEATLYLKLPASDAPRLVSGEYTAATTAAEMTIDATKSFWNYTDKANLNDKIKNRIAEGSKIEVIDNGNHNYTIAGTLQGTSDKTGNPTSLEISFSGTLPFEDYADPEPVEPTVPEVAMTVGNLDYYDNDMYTLTLKDASPTDTYEATFSFKLPASDTPQLISGDYPVSTTGGEMTLDATKSSWTFIDKNNFNDRIRNKIEEGTLRIDNNGGHDYTVTGTLKGTSDTGEQTAIRISFSGTVPFNDYSTPPAPDAPKAVMTVGDLYYNGDNVFYLGLKDASRVKEYSITFYITLAPANPLQLASGDYTGSDAGGEMTYDLTKSFWNYNDPIYGMIKNRIQEGTLKIVANGNDDYTITGMFKATDEDGKETELEIEYTGTLPCEDYSY